MSRRKAIPGQPTPPPMFTRHTLRVPAGLWGWIVEGAARRGLTVSEHLRALLMALRDKAMADGDRG